MMHFILGVNSVPYLDQTLNIEWCVVTYASKNEHQKGIMCLKDIGLSDQNLWPILGSRFNIIGGTWLIDYKSSLW